MNNTLTTKMPTEVAQVYTELFRDMCQLQLNWKLLRDLFARPDEQIDLLNRTIPDLAKTLHSTLQDIVYLGLCRMTDPSAIGRESNMTLNRLVEVSRGHLNPARLQEFVDAVAATKAACEECRKHRNKRIAHSDEQWAKQPSFKRPSPQYVEQALESCRKALNVLHVHFEGTGSVMYEAVTHARGGGEALYVQLGWAEKYRELRMRAITGKVTAETVLSELIHGPW